jgi:hypothetical protein
MRAERLRYALALVLVFTALTQNADAAVRVYGYFKLKYKEAGSCSGSLSDNQGPIPVRRALVEIRNASNSKLASAATDEKGYVDLTVDALKAGQAFKVLLNAQSEATTVKDADGKIYAVQWSYASASAATNLGTLTLDAATDSSVPKARQAFLTLERAVQAQAYAKGKGSAIKSVTAIWPSANGGTYYDNLANKIHVGVSPGDGWGDGFLHEYGHYVDDMLTAFAGAAGLQNHTFCGSYSDAEGVFGEGWASYFALAVRNKTYMWPNVGLCDAEKGDCAAGEKIEGNVTAVLWDIHDGNAAECFDKLKNPQKLWDVMEEFQWSNPSLDEFIEEFSDPEADKIACLYTLPSCAPKVTSPSAAGITWKIGQPVAITWQGFTGCKVSLMMYKSDMPQSNLFSLTPNDGSETYTVGNWAPGADYKVRITQSDPYFQGDMSDVSFRIVEDPKVIYPSAAGITLKRGSACEIKWSGLGGSKVKIELYKGGALSLVVASAAANNGAYKWTVPAKQAAGSDYRIKVSSATASDSSDAVFTIN